jgi:2-oxoglutarate ferredoxin oxidoreductase subunit beta
MATGIKRVNPDSIVFTYQGDGDLASIGIAEAIHAATRGEKITTIFLNNAIYGMTGGQMAPTSLIGQKTTSSPVGRQSALAGDPIQSAALMAGLPGTVYSVRRSLHDAKNIIKAKKAIKTAFQAQVMGLGFSLVELLSTCPTNWGLTPAVSCDWVRDEMIPVYPLGDYKVVDALKN